MTEPKSSIARFGVSLVGPKFMWGYEDDAGEYHEEEFRARRALTFDDLLDFNTRQAILQSDAVFSQQRLGKQLEAAASDESLGEGTQMAQIEAAAAESAVAERRRWGEIIETCLMLVAEGDRERLRPLLESGNPTDVRHLRDHLRSVVIDHIVADVEVAARVDPTSPPSSAD